MPISFACKCGKRLAVKDELAGKKIKCPGCQAVVPIPQKKVAPAAAGTPANVIAVSCGCGKRFNAKKELAGKRIKCPACQSVVTVSANGKLPAKAGAAASASAAAKPKKPAVAPPSRLPVNSPKTAGAPAKKGVAVPAKLPAAKAPAAKVPAAKAPTAKAPAKAPAKSAPIPPKPSPAPSPTAKAGTKPTPVPKEKGGGGGIIIAAALGVLLLIGAGIYFFFLSGPSTAIVTGTVTLDGQLVVFGKVQFIAKDGTVMPFDIGPEGKYAAKGLPYGDAKITVKVPLDNPKMYLARIKSATYIAERNGKQVPKMKPANIPIPDDYADTAKTPLQLTVREDGQVFNIEMQGKGAGGG